MLLLSKNDLQGLLTPAQTLAAVEVALRSSADKVVMPKRAHIDWEGGTLLTMPAVAGEVFGVKIVTIIPGNSSRGLPIVDGLMLLSESETGRPLALLNAAALTSQRTGAVGALGVKYSTPESISSVGIVGCGAQGAWQAIFACAVRPIKEIHCSALHLSSLDAFRAAVRQHVPGVKISVCSGVRELLERTELVIAATTSSVPVLPDEPNLLKGKHFISVGSYKPSMQELPDCAYRLSGAVVVDTMHACEEVGDVINPLRRGLIQQSDVFPIADFVTGKRVLDSSQTTVYKSVGAAIYDVYVARALHSAAVGAGRGTEVNL